MKIINKIKYYYQLFSLFRNIRKYTIFFVLIHILGLLCLGINTLIPFALKHLTESIQQAEFSILLWVPPVMLSLTIVFSALMACRKVMMQIVSMRLGFGLQKLIYKKFLAMDLIDHFKITIGDKMSKITFDTVWLAQGAMVFFSDILYMPFMFAIYSVLMFYVDWKLTLIAILSAPFVLAINIVIGKRIRMTSLAIQNQNAKYSRHLVDTLDGILVVKSFRKEASEIRKFSSNIEDYVKCSVKDVIWRSVLNPVSKIINMLVLCLMAWYAFNRLTIVKDLTVANFVAFSSLLFLFHKEIQKISVAVQSIARAEASHERILSVLNIPIKSLPSKTVEINKFNTLRGENISYSYGEKKVFSNINFEIKKGGFVLFTGASGVGKTTLLRIIGGLLTTQQGKILIDSHELLEIDSDKLKSLISYAPQSTTLFSMSIRKNIAYGNPEATEDEIIEAAKLACAHEFIMQLPEQYNTGSGDVKEKLSGGQAQRITIARAILMKAPLLILDECFSNIDLSTEIKIYKNLMTMAYERTIILVTHRLTAIKKVNCIFHFEGGELKEVGTHDELISLNGSYSKFYSAHEQINSINKIENASA